jgi:hypothetical protein
VRNFERVKRHCWLNQSVRRSDNEQGAGRTALAYMPSLHFFSRPLYIMARVTLLFTLSWVYSVRDVPEHPPRWYSTNKRRNEKKKELVLLKTIPFQTQVSTRNIICVGRYVFLVMCVYLVTAKTEILSKICNKKKNDFKEATCVTLLRNAKRKPAKWNANSFWGNGHETARIWALLFPFMYIFFFLSSSSKNISYLTLQSTICFNMRELCILPNWCVSCDSGKRIKRLFTHTALIS